MNAAFVKVKSAVLLGWTPKPRGLWDLCRSPSEDYTQNPSVKHIGFMRLCAGFWTWTDLDYSLLY